MPLLPIQAEKPYLSDGPVVQLSSLRSTRQAEPHSEGSQTCQRQTKNHERLVIDVRSAIMLICKKHTQGEKQTHVCTLHKHFHN